MDWNTLQKVVREIDEHCIKVWGKKMVNPEAQAGRTEMLQGIRQLFDWLEDNRPGWQEDPGWPRKAVRWWRRDRDNSGRGGYFPMWKDFTSEILLTLKPNALKLYITCCCAAWRDDEPNPEGMNWGEFFKGNDRLCREARISHSNSWIAFRELYDIGLLINVRKHPKYGTWIRRVVMDGEARLLLMSRRGEDKPQDQDDGFERLAYPAHHGVENQCPGPTLKTNVGAEP